MTRNANHRPAYNITITDPRGSMPSVEELQKKIDDASIMALALGLLMTSSHGETRATMADSYYAISRANKTDRNAAGPTITRQQAIVEVVGSAEYQNRLEQMELARTTAGRLIVLQGAGGIAELPQRLSSVA